MFQCRFNSFVQFNLYTIKRLRKTRPNYYLCETYGSETQTHSALQYCPCKSLIHTIIIITIIVIRHIQDLDLEHEHTDTMIVNLSALSTFDFMYHQYVSTTNYYQLRVLVSFAKYITILSSSGHWSLLREKNSEISNLQFKKRNQS